MLCWAKGFGPCSDVQSREHYFSAGLFSDDRVIVGGFGWTGEDERVIGLASMVVRNLCTTHNAFLSSVDSEAVSLRASLDDMVTTLESCRSGEDVAALSATVFNVDGCRFERWLLKLLIGVVYADKSGHWHGQAEDSQLPPLAVREAAMGVRDLVAPQGLYTAPPIGDGFTPRGDSTFGAYRGVLVYAKHHPYLRDGQTGPGLSSVAFRADG